MATTPPPVPNPPPPTTRMCPGCDQEIGVNEKECPKCKLNLEEADAEDGVVERALARLKKKNAKKKAAPGAPPAPPEPKKKSVFASLNRKKG